MPGTSKDTLTVPWSPMPVHKRINAVPVTPDHLMVDLAIKKPHITKSQMRELREAFRLFDKDGDGAITKDELGSVMRSLGQFARAEELREMLEEIDTDGDGNVSFEEFVEIASNMGASASSSSTDQNQEEQELRDAFRVFDKRNRGYITASDLRAVLQCLGEDLSEDEIEDMIKEVDVDGDGRIDFYEFVRALGEPGIDDDDDDVEEYEEYVTDEQEEKKTVVHETPNPAVKSSEEQEDVEDQMQRLVTNYSEEEVEEARAVHLSSTPP
ncbi:calmodulin-A-like [Copidosoma floridanum]|uniref:calmodulin-A-like n=1 Tax=Copidosoma floridanum TaxID=29053 RepID=UPI0006C97AF9|nr:calmodulin-A-like [Copidosoma floridanum]